MRLAGFLIALLLLAGCQGVVDVAEKVNKTLTFRDFEVYKTDSFYCIIDIPQNSVDSCNYGLLVRVNDDKSFASMTVDDTAGVYYFADVDRSNVGEWIKYIDDFIAWKPQSDRDFVIKNAHMTRTHRLRSWPANQGYYPVVYRVVAGQKFLIFSEGDSPFALTEKNAQGVKETLIGVIPLLKN